MLGMQHMARRRSKVRNWGRLLAGLLGHICAMSFVVPSGPGQADAFRALMRAAGELPLDLLSISVNGSTLREHDYDDVVFKEGLHEISKVWSETLRGRELREVCMAVEADWIKAACGELSVTLRVEFQTGDREEMEFDFFGGSDEDAHMPGESAFWECAEEALRLGPSGWSQAAASLPFEAPAAEEEEDDLQDLYPPYPNIYEAVVATFFAQHLGLTKLQNMVYTGRCRLADQAETSLCRAGDFRYFSS